MEDKKSVSTFRRKVRRKNYTNAHVKCSECGIPTRYWWTPSIPLCQDCAEDSPKTPKEPGFYWWRKTNTGIWRMVEVVDISDDHRKPHLVSSDIQHHEWKYRSFKHWNPCFAVGEWVKVSKPRN